MSIGLVLIGIYVSGCIFFFFQAEDGIRDDLVTGVQTCALPIYLYLRLYNTCTLCNKTCA